MGGKDGMRDPRFKVMHQGEELSLVTRFSDGQMLFPANMATKMNDQSALGSRIAEVHRLRGITGCGAHKHHRRMFCAPCNPLPKIAPPAELFVFDVMHETYLRMNETGTEAAAATGVVVGITSVLARPLTFRVDRPHLIALRDRATGTLLFLGRVTDPR